MPKVISKVKAKQLANDTFTVISHTIKKGVDFKLEANCAGMWRVTRDGLVAQGRRDEMVDYYNDQVNKC